MPLFSRPVALDPGSPARCRSAPSYVFNLTTVPAFSLCDASSAVPSKLSCRTTSPRASALSATSSHSSSRRSVRLKSVPSCTPCAWTARQAMYGDSIEDSQDRREGVLTAFLYTQPAELDPLIGYHFDVMPAVYGASLNTGEHWTEVFFGTTKKATLRSLFSTTHEPQ